MQPSTRKPAKPSAAKPPTADLPELDLGEAPPAPAKTAVTVSAITAVAGADNAAIDAQLDALATRTTVEDLARRGKKNLKTLSERQLKEWIHEALRRVISTTTTVSAAEQERMISATRAELGNLMSEAGSAHAEREALHARIAQLNADRETMQRRLSELEQRLDDAAGQIADAETAAATAADPDIEEVESLRAELGETYSRLSASENERASLQKTLGARLIATSEVAAAVLELDRSCYGGLHMQQAQTDAAGDAAAFYADEAAARATAESLTRDLIGLRTDLASAAPGVPDESIAADRLRLASLVGRPAGDPDALAAAERERDEARSAAENAKRTVARLLAQGEAKANEAVTARITRAEQQARSANDRLAQCEGELAAITRRHAELEVRATSLSDELAAARDSLRNAAGRAEALSAEVSRLTRENAELRASAARSSALAAECDRLALIARNAEQARREPTSAPAAARASEAQNTALAAECDRLAELAKTVGQARRDGVQPAATATPACESTPARLAFANGAWRWTWGTGARLRVATFRGAWSAAEFLDLPPAANVVHLAQGRYGAWRDANGHGQFQLSGSAPQQLGAVQATPLLARGGAGMVPFAGLASAAGVVGVVDGDGAAHELSHRLNMPPAAGSVCAWWWAHENSRHLAYRDGHGGVHELLELDGTWYGASLSGHTGCPPAASDPLGYAPADHEHVVFRAADGHIHELCFNGERWMDHDLTALSGCPPAIGQPSGAYIAGRHHIAFRASDGLLHLLRLRSDWRHTPLPRLGRSEADPVLASSGSEGALAWSSGGTWQWARLGDDPAAASGEPLPA